MFGNREHDGTISHRVYKETLLELTFWHISLFQSMTSELVLLYSRGQAKNVIETPPASRARCVPQGFGCACDEVFSNEKKIALEEENILNF